MKLIDLGILSSSELWFSFTARGTLLATIPHGRSPLRCPSSICE
jgi:hypothetical protein